jgi:multidrug efflux pump subunit AcrA (membrane-fusion protein)
VATVDEPLWYTGRSRDLPPEIESAAQSYVDCAHTRSLAVVPLKESPCEDEPRDPEPAVGILVFEWFGGEARQHEQGERVRTVCRHGTSALANALAYNSIPLVRLSRRIRWLASPKRLPRLLVGLLAVFAVLAVLTFAKSDFHIRCRGQLQPELRRKVFAPVDGQVDRLNARHGDQVAAGQILATLRSSDLEYEYTRVLGEIQTATEQRNAAQAFRLGANPTTAAARDEHARLTAEEERLKKSLENLRRQKRLLEERRAGLEVRSPIRGQMLTWEVTEVLETRPVGRGQVLMTVADTEGPWVLEVRVPDKHIGYVRQARRELKKDLDVTFVLATDPGRKHVGKVDKVAMITEPDETENLSVLVTIAFDRGSVTNLHPGAGATARIRCGRRSLGYVWLHDLIEALRARFFL